MKNKINKDKIELICYFDGNITFEPCINHVFLKEPLKFIPRNLRFSEEEIENIIKILLQGNHYFKLTIEEVEE